MTNATRDPLILAALRDRVITTDPVRGLVLRHGQPIERINAHGYAEVYLSRGYTARAHRVIWIDAHGMPDDPTLQINHRNRIRHDNRLDNLELVTASQNQAHARGSFRYNGIRPEDEATVDQDWLSRVQALAARGDVTADELAALRGWDIPDPQPLPRLYKRSKVA